MLSPLPAKLRARSRIQRTSHVRLQRKSCAEKGNPGGGLIVNQMWRQRSILFPIPI